MVAQLARYQRQQRKASALALIVGAQDDEHIFARDDQHHRPENERQHTEDMRGIDRERMVTNEAFLQRIKR